MSANLFLDVRYDENCPYCNKDVFKHIWKANNILSISDIFEDFDVDGFATYRYAYYKCPHCNRDFCIKVRNTDTIVKEYKRLKTD